MSAYLIILLKFIHRKRFVRKTSVICHFIARIPLLKRVVRMIDALWRMQIICHLSFTYGSAAVTVKSNRRLYIVHFNEPVLYTSIRVRRRFASDSFSSERMHNQWLVLTQRWTNPITTMNYFFITSHYSFAIC